MTLPSLYAKHAREVTALVRATLLIDDILICCGLCQIDGTSHPGAHVYEHRNFGDTSPAGIVRVEWVVPKPKRAKRKGGRRG